MKTPLSSCFVRKMCHLATLSISSGWERISSTKVGRLHQTEAAKPKVSLFFKITNKTIIKMRNLVCLIVIAIFMASCSKEKFAERSADNHGEIKLITLTAGSKTGVTLLEFSSVEHYEATIASLEAQMEQHENAFLAAWSSLSDDALNAKEDEVGFVDHQPLINFENYYNIPLTLRQVYVAAEELWLNNDELNIETYPKKKYPFSLVEMTLLNGNGEVKIGDKIIKLTDRGFVEIRNLDVATLIRINEGDETAYSEPTVTTNIEFDGGGKGECTN
ncbi:MAG: hypothetical protein IPM52_09190 [Bacteroidetes bacterium]|nr:hypothetical protein [Bacteroidota bacterium]